jgi:ferritin
MDDFEEKKEKIDKLRTVYDNLNDSEKEKFVRLAEELLKEKNDRDKEILEAVAGQFKKVWKSINEIKKHEMSEQEINMWSVLISVLKNQNRDYESIQNILEDTFEIKEFIKKGERGDFN